MNRGSRPPAEQPVQDAPAFDTRLIWAGLFLSLAAFSKVPNIDLWFSQRYYTEQAGFFQATNPAVIALYDWTPVIGKSLLVLAAVIAAGAPWWSLLLHRLGSPGAARLMRGLWRRTAIMALWVVVLSSGLLGELVFKELIGRPRPIQTIEFGGTEPFHSLFEIGDDTSNQRSFISGHAAAGFSLICIGWWAGAVWRRRWLLIGLVAGTIVGLGRIMQGGHYLSDVVFSFYAVWLSCELVAFVMRRFDDRNGTPWPTSAPRS